jgi:hypothetical protein
MERITRTTYETGQKQIQDKFIEVEIKPGIIIDYHYLSIDYIIYLNRLEKWNQNNFSQ